MLKQNAIVKKNEQRVKNINKNPCALHSMPCGGKPAVNSKQLRTSQVDIVIIIRMKWLLRIDGNTIPVRTTADARKTVAYAHI
jgi:hypothetical protein